jgi:pyridoxine 4-dehydrogenase
MIIRPEFIRKSVDNIIAALGPNKKLDLFEPARIDKDVPVEEMMNTLSALVKEGKFTHIGLSECSAATLRKAHAVRCRVLLHVDHQWEMAYLGGTNY